MSEGILTFILIVSNLKAVWFLEGHVAPVCWTGLPIQAGVPVKLLPVLKINVFQRVRRVPDINFLPEG
jgi:hypothetical protein